MAEPTERRMVARGTIKNGVLWLDLSPDWAGEAIEVVIPASEQAIILAVGVADEGPPTPVTIDLTGTDTITIPPGGIVVGDA